MRNNAFQEATEEQKPDKTSLFGKSFFDSGKHMPGAFTNYYFEDYYTTFKPLCKIIKKHFRPKRVLDVGCAKGSFVFAFRQTGIEAYGVDVSSYAISCAPDFLQPFLNVVDLDVDSLPFEDNYFDFVTFLGSIEYLHNHRHVIAELERVMIDGATLLLTSISKRHEGDLYRINVHRRRFWIKEFGEHWSLPEAYYGFMRDFFRRADVSGSVLSMVKRSLFGVTRFSDRVLVFSRDVMSSLGALDYLILLLTLSKSH